MSDYKFKEFEAILLRFSALKNRFQYIVELFPKGKPNKNDEHLKFLLYELAIINLNCLSEIRPTFIRILRLTNGLFFEETIRDLWIPINDYSRSIKRLRDSFFAHTGHKDDPFLEIHPLIFIQDSNFPSQYGDILFLLLCGFHYLLLIEDHYKIERNIAELKWKEKTHKIGKVETGIYMTSKNIFMAHKKLSDIVRSKVVSAGYNFVEPQIK